MRQIRFKRGGDKWRRDYYVSNAFLSSTTVKECDMLFEVRLLSEEGWKVELEGMMFIRGITVSKGEEMLRGQSVFYNGPAPADGGNRDDDRLGKALSNVKDDGRVRVQQANGDVDDYEWIAPENLEGYDATHGNNRGMCCWQEPEEASAAPAAQQQSGHEHHGHGGGHEHHGHDEGAEG